MPSSEITRAAAAVLAQNTAPDPQSPIGHAGGSDAFTFATGLVSAMMMVGGLGTAAVAATPSYGVSDQTRRNLRAAGYLAFGFGFIGMASVVAKIRHASTTPQSAEQHPMHTPPQRSGGGSETV